MRIYIDENDCVGCGQCTEICENIKPGGNYSVYVDQESCVLCRKCLEFDCPGEAIKLEKVGG